ncbi:hypothetical protein Trydic_g22604 [Trypoxylus dichotomus]
MLIACNYQSSYGNDYIKGFEPEQNEVGQWDGSVETDMKYLLGVVVVYLQLSERLTDSPVFGASRGLLCNRRFDDPVIAGDDFLKAFPAQFVQEFLEIFSA